MNDAEKIIRAQRDDEVRNGLIDEYSDFIRKCASKASGRFIDIHDDAWSVALIAFNEAITAYDPDKGPFEAFAGTVIRNRVTDHMRSESRHAKVLPFSALSKEDDSGEEAVPQIEDTKAGVSEAALEIASLQSELAPFGISFFDLPAASPKSQKTKAACMSVIHFLAGDKELYREVCESRQLPAGRITSTLAVSSKLLDRHRKYIIAGMLIIGGDYTVMGEYFDQRKEVQRR